MSNTTRPKITGKRGVVSAGHYLSAAAGVKMFAKGGNAVDAGVAAGFALNVLKPNENSLGGECPILVYSPDEKKVFAISGQGVAPGKATAQWFADHNIDLIPGDGYLGATVPGMFGSYCAALGRFGRLTLAEVLEPALELAGEGFPIHGNLQAAIKNNSQKYINEWPSSAEVYMPGGKVPEAGQVLKQPALANTYRRVIAAEKEFAGEGRARAIERAVEYFYDKIADDIIEFTHSFPVKDASGESHVSLLEKSDFANYKTRIDEPASAKYRNCEVFKCGPWTQGPVFLQQLKLLEGFDLRGIGHNTADYIHLVIECAKLAFADRENYYGDPLFCDVPLKKLLSEEYNARRRKKIDLSKANNGRMWEEASGGCCEGGFDCDTTHLDVIGCDGFMMSATPSGGWIPTSPVIPKLGFPLGTRGQMFNFAEGHPNSLLPGKRPRTTLTPSLAFKDGKPWMVFGTPGGDMQDQWALQFFLNAVDFGMDIQRAIDAPSFYTNHFVNSFYPKNAVIGKVYAEADIGLGELMKLQAKGHDLSLLGPGTGGQVCAVTVDPDTGVIAGAASAKGDGQAYAMGW